MFKPVLGLVAAFAASTVFAQAADAPSASASRQEAPAKVAPVKAVLGMIKEKTESADRLSDFCDLSSSMKLPSRSTVVVVREVTCVPRYGAESRKEFLEVLYGGKTHFVPTDAVSMFPEDVKRLEDLEPDQIEASAEDWRLTSVIARKRQLEKAFKALDATSKHGVALLDVSIFDVSEHTEGTGFELTVYNPTKKTIKYVTITVVGLNAVGDPVRDGFRGNAAPMLRGIGPIEPGETGSYSKDYMWMTDIVQSFRISSIKVEYTDGSSRVVSDVKKVRIRPEDYEVLMIDND